jgi:hypothetical protein
MPTWGGGAALAASTSPLPAASTRVATIIRIGRGVKRFMNKPHLLNALNCAPLP